MEKLSRQEKSFIWCWNLLLLIIVFIPHIIAFTHSGNGLHFNYLTEPETKDLNAYFAWIRQAREGRWLFSDLFTTEPSNGFFHPVFLFMGKLLRAGLSLSFVWYGIRIIANTLLVFSIYKLLNTILPEARQRYWSLVLITLGGGFGWLVGNLSADSAQTEATILQSLRWPFIYSIAIALFVTVLTNVYLYYQTRLIKYSWWAGIGGLLLIFVHLYDAIILYPLIAVLSILNIYKSKLWQNKINLYKIMPIFLLSLPGLAYYFWLFTNDWVFMSNTQFKMLGSGIQYYLLSFGTLPLIALVGVYKLYNTKSQNNTLFILLTWIIVQGILILIPFGFERKLIMGLIIPIGALAGVGISYIIEKLLQSQVIWLLKSAILLIILSVMFMSLPTNAMVLSRDIQNAQSGSFPYFIPDNIKESLDWVDKNIHGNDNIIALPNTGNIIPRATGIHVFAGHWAQTINAPVKYQMDMEFYQGRMSQPRALNWLKQNNIDYIYFGPEEQRIGTNWMTNFPSAYAPVYEHDSIIIYKVNYE